MRLVVVFEDYLQDAYEFHQIARQHSKDGNARLARRYFRSSVFCIAGSIEAFVNYIADSFAKAKSIPEPEICFLNDRALIFSANKGVHERSEYHRLDEKIRVLMKRFQADFDFDGKTWVKFMQFKDLRDSLVHPRDFEDETPLGEYSKEVSEGLTAVIDVMNVLSKSIFRKPLRRKLLDLTPE
jgi:hypothetical protein